MALRLIDITRSLNRTPVYPGDPAPKLSVFSSLSAGDPCNMATLTTVLHAGTHTDAPLHFLRTGADAGSLPLSPFIGECAVLDFPPGPITGQTADERFAGLERVLIKGGGRAYLDRTGAEAAAFAGVKLVGTDALSVGSEKDEAGPHRALLEEGVAILENLDLSKVAPGKYFLVALPVKIDGADAAPVRAVLLDGYLFWSN